MSKKSSGLKTQLIQYFRTNAKIPQQWDCSESPIGTCVYLEDRDPMQDDCIFCHDPRERK